MSTTWLLNSRILRAGCACLLLVSYNSVAKSDAVWTSATGGSWFDATKWNAAVPNAVGDLAQLQWSPGGNISVAMASAATLGQLNIAGPAVFNLNGAGPLVFDNFNNEDAVLRVFGRAAAHQLNVPVQITDKLQIDVLSGDSLRVGSTFSGGPVMKTGGGVLELAAANATWASPILISGGEVTVSNATALGVGTSSAADGVKVSIGGTLRFNTLAALTNELIQLLSLD